MALPNESNDPSPNSQAQMQAGGPHQQSLNDAPMPNSIPLQLQQQQVPLDNGGIALLPGGAHHAQSALRTYQSNQRILESQERTLTAQNTLGKQLQVIHLQQQINNPLELQGQTITEPIDLAMTEQAASVAAPTATDLDGANQRPMMAEAASVAAPTATDLDGANQRPMMAQAASVAAPTATDLDGANQRPVMAQAASVAAPTATDLDGANQKPMMAQAASVATPTATDLDDVNQSDQLERMSRVAEEKKLQSTLQSIAPAPPPQKQSVPVNEPDVHAAAVAKPTHGVIQEKRTASAAAKTCESVQQQAKQAATAASHQAVPVVENQPTNGAQSGLQRVRQILPAVEAKKLAAKKPAPPTQRHETGERPFQRRTLFAPVGPHPQAASVAKKPLTSAIEPERTTANGSAPLNGKSVSFPTNNGQAGNQEAAYVRVKKRKATAELGKGRVTPEVEIIEVRQAQKLPQNARLHRKVTPQEPLAVPMHGTPWRFDPKAVAARATTAPHNIAPHPANVNAYYQHQVKVHQAQVHQAQVHQAQLHQAQVHQAQALQQQRLLQRQQLLHMQGQPWPPQRQQETLHQQDRTMAGLIRYDIGPSFVPLGPPQLPVLYRSFYNLKSEVGAVFQAIGLLVMNARDPYKVSPQTKPSYALTASYHDFKIHLTPSQPEKTQKTCSKIVYALTCHACFLKGAVNNGRCCSSSVYFPDDAKSFQKHFYTLKLHLMSCPNVSASLKGYLFGTKRQLPNLVGETNRRLPGFRGTASEPAFLRQMCESYGLFEPNADPSRHRLETIVKERIYNDNVGAMEDALKTTSMTLRGVIGEGVCDVVDADIVNDDPFCLFVFECLEVIRIYRQRSLPEYRRLFNHKSVQDDDNELFMLQCQCCHGRRKDGSFNQEAVVLMNDGGQCSENLMRMIFDHFGTCFSSHRLQKLNILRIDPIAEHEQFSHFAVSIHKHIVSLITWARGVQEASPTEPPSCDQELWKSISIEQFRELLNTWNTIPVSNLLGPKKPDGSPGSAVLDCVGFPKIGILHGKIETPTVNDLKTTFRKRGPQPPELTSRRAINKRAARPSSKALDVEVLPAVLSPKAHKYLKDNTVVLLDNL